MRNRDMSFTVQVEMKFERSRYARPHWSVTILDRPGRFFSKVRDQQQDAFRSQLEYVIHGAIEESFDRRGWMYYFALGQKGRLI